MTERIQESQERVVRDGDGVVQSAKRVTTSVNDTDEAVVRPVAREEATNVAARVVYYISGLLLTLLAFRFVLSLLGANRGNAFADLIYSVTYPFVAPFFGLFGYSVKYGVARFEIETLVAMAVYALLAYGIVKLMDIPRHSTNT